MIYTHPGVSRAEIAQESGLSKAAVSAIVADLLESGWLTETWGGTGRRRVGLQVNPQAGQAIGLEMAAEACVAVLADGAGQSLLSVTRSLEPTESANDAVRQAAALVQNLLRSARTLPVGIGVSVTGLVDAVGETAWLFAPPAWAGETPLASLLSEQLSIHVPVTVINTFHAGALGEYHHGAGRGADDMIFISVGERIGAGLVLAGDLYTGNSGGAGEVGHMVIDPNGPRCSCGNMGCLEAMAGGQAVIAWTRQALKAQGREQLATGQGLTLHAVVEAATMGDVAALSAVRQAGEYLGLATVGLVNTLNPRRVVIGGWLAETGDTLLDPIRQTILRRAAPAAYSAVDIVQAALGANAAAMGAATLALKRHLFSTL